MENGTCQFGGWCVDAIVMLCVMFTVCTSEQHTCASSQEAGAGMADAAQTLINIFIWSTADALMTYPGLGMISV